jgi:type IV pilus assembly protein PilW
MYSLDDRSRQQGAMLLELMTGLVISLMVTLSALAMLAFLQTSSAMQGEAFRLHQRVDVALQTIGQQVRQAGAIELRPSQNGATVQFSSAFDGYGGSGRAIHGEDGVDDAPDTLLISYQDSADARDCLGNQPDSAQAGVRVDSRFTLSADTLRCLGAHHSTGSQVIADRVEDFQVSYGLHVDTALGSVYRYVDATAVGPDWSVVRAVRVCLQVSSERRLQTPAAVDLRDCHGATLRSDGRIRRVATATFSLRNPPL